MNLELGKRISGPARTTFSDVLNWPTEDSQLGPGAPKLYVFPILPISGTQIGVRSQSQPAGVGPDSGRNRCRHSKIGEHVNFSIIQSRLSRYAFFYCSPWFEQEVSQQCFCAPRLYFFVIFEFPSWEFVFIKFRGTADPVLHVSVFPMIVVLFM